MSQQIPVTVLTGFLGAGKTTLLNRILAESHGRRIAVIENEFGETGIDNELLVRTEGEQIVEMNNGCICCTVRGDLTRILGELAQRRREGRSEFERVIIETTGLADPAPVAQTFFIEPSVAADYRIDAIVTVVDAKHAPQQLDEHHEAQEQVGYADRILISKADLVAPDALAALRERLTRMNPRAPQKTVHFGRTDIADILDIRGFDLDAILAIDPNFLDDVSHEHDEDVAAFVYRAAELFEAEKFEAFIAGTIGVHGADLLRYKGVLSIAGRDTRQVIQGVHMTWGMEAAAPWAPGEPRESVIVFIGRNLPRELFEVGLNYCLQPAPAVDDTP